MANFVTKTGTEILVNTTTQNGQYGQKITALDGGGFVITWTDYSEQGGDQTERSVRAQVFDADGEKIGSEILVNTTTQGFQGDQEITALDNGGFVITWNDASQQGGDTSNEAVRAQVFNASGGTVGSEILVNTSTTNTQYGQKITPLDGGGFVVTWTDISGLNGDSNGQAVKAQVFDATGGPVGNEILVNTTTNGFQGGPEITTLDGGGFVIIWTDDSGQGDDISAASVRAQVFNAGGSTVGGEILVNTTTENDQTDQKTTALDNGGFVVTWTDQSGQNGDTSALSVRAQVFNASGSMVGSEILVNTITSSFQYQQQIAAIDGGGFVVTWHDESFANDDSYAVRAQVFAANGTKLGGEYLVNTTTNGDQSNPQITALDDGFVITWTDQSQQNGDTSGLSVRAQMFQINGAFAVNDTGEMQANADVTLFDVRANDSPSDVGTVGQPGSLIVIGNVPGLDANDVTATVVNNQIGIDLGADFDKLQAGETAFVSMSYTITDPFGGFGTAFLTVTVTGVNDAPYLQNKSFTLDEDAAIGGNMLDGVTDADGDAFLVVAINGNGDNVGTSFQGAYGTLTLRADGIFTYVADNSSQLSSGESATDTFTITVRDNQGSEITRNLAFDVAGSDDIITGTLAADILNGTEGRDIIFGDGGNDTIDGRGGDDLMLGGAGDDTYTVNQFDDFVVEFETEGTDTVKSTISWTLADNVENLVLLGSAFSGTGNARANTITGTTANNVLDGGAGNDKLIGGAGDDLYYVDATGDVIVEAANQGVETVFSTATSYTLSANVEYLFLSTGATSGTGNALANIINGNNLNNMLDGGAGNDLINGGLGADRMTGGAGDDEFTVDDIGDTIVELANGGNDTVTSTAAAYTLATHVENLLLDAGAISGTGNAGNNFITAYAANNILNGGGGNDTLDGGTGADQMFGGAGNDIFFVDDNGDTVNEFANEGTDEVRTTLLFTNLTANVENLTLLDGAKQALGNSLANVITGNSGDNTLDGNGGIDTLKGGFGNDSYYVNVAGDIVTELANQGTDTVYSDSTAYTLSANVENLTLLNTGNYNGTGNTLNNVMLGNSGNNILDGGTGNDFLDGGAGTDTLKGGAGNDQYFVNVSGDTIVEAAASGTDIVFSTASSYQLSANVENLTILSSAGIASGIGNTSNNILTGNEFVNSLFGDDGNDTLDSGSAGNGDSMFGGKGNDTFYFKHAGVTAIELSNEGIDTVIRSFVSTGPLAANVENLILTVGGHAVGNELNNVITGSVANNTIVGNGGNDILKGGGGADTFVFSSGFGKDTVTDFIGGPSGDRIEFDQFLFADESAILAATTDTAVGLVITSGTNTVTLAGFHLNSYTAGDFYVGGQ